MKVTASFRCCLLVALLLLYLDFEAVAFVIPPGYGLARRSTLSYSSSGSSPLLRFEAAQVPDVSRTDNRPTEDSDKLRRTAADANKEGNEEEQRIILPPQTRGVSTTTKSTINKRPWTRISSNSKDSTENWWNKITSKFKKRFKKPSTQFRAVFLSVSTVLAFVLLRATKGAPVSLATAVQKWIQTRGFQGLSAFGRTVAYGWAALVAYPRLLDRRAAERKQKRRDQQLELRRNELMGLAAEVSRLRQELAAIDAEIRSFRREIISLRALVAAQGGNNNNNNNKTNDTMSNDSTATPHVDSVQEAIAAEMAHLGQLRADTQAALTVARQLWAEARAQAPPEAWPATSVFPPP